MAKKAQGLPLSFIVIAAISALVLILVIAFTIGGLGGFFKQITVAGGSEELSTVQAACNSACTRAQTTATNLDVFKGTDYCKRTFTIDLNRNGKVEQQTPSTGTGETGIHCWEATRQVKVGTAAPTTESGPNVACTVQIGAKSYTADSAVLTAGKDCTALV